VAELEIRLLGGFSLASDGMPVLSIRLPRQRELLTWLLLHPGQAQSRVRIASLFWPDASEAQGRNNLRKVVHESRIAWPLVDTWVASDRTTITWLVNRPYRLDVDVFSRLASPEADSETIRAATSAYAGDLLPDCFEEWILPFRFELRSRYIELLERGMSLAEQQRDFKRAIVYGERLLQSESLREDVYASLMRLHALAGDRAGAVRVYHACASTIELELGVSPGSEIEEMYQRLLSPPPEAAAEVLPARGRRMDFIGRQEELRSLQSVWRSVVEGGRAIAVVTGDPGIGKTRLAEEMQEWTERQGLAVCRASCHAGEESLPFAAITQLLAYCPLSSLPATHQRQLSLLVPHLSEDNPDWRRPDSLAEDWRKRLLFDAIAYALLAAQPVLLIVDDLHWCDADSLLALEYLLRSVPAPRCLLLATAHVETGRSAASLLRDAKLHALVVEIELAPLDLDDTLRLAGAQDVALTGASSNPDQANKLYGETEGNPLFVLELVRSGWKPDETHQPVLPRSLQSAVHARFARLCSEAQELLEVAATAGSVFRLPILAHASHQNEDAFVRSIDELWRQRIIREQSGDGYEFSHGKLREVAYSALSSARRARLHGRVATAYRAHGSGPTDPSIRELARHLELAGRRSEAAQAYVEAADAARRLHANESAATLYRHALELVSADDRPEVLIRLGETLQVTGDWPEAERLFQEALNRALAERAGVIANRCRIALGDLLRLSGRFSEALEWLETARKDLEPPKARDEDHAALARVLSLSCETLLWLARYQEAEECAQRQLAVAQKAGDRAAIAAAYQNLGTVHARRTHYDEALDYYKRSLALEEQLEDPARLLGVLGQLGNLHRLRGEFGPAKLFLQRELSIARQIGNVHAEARAAGNLSNVMQEEGELVEAKIWLEKALATFRRLGDRQREAASLGNLGTILHQQGDLGRAWRHISQSVDMQTEVGDRRNAAVGLAELGTVYSDAGSFGHAVACLTAGILISLDIGNPQNVTIAAGAMGEACLRQGRISDSEAFAGRAAALARLLKMSYWLGVELNLLARVHDATGRLDRALASNSEALDGLKDSPRSEVLFRAQLLQGRLRAATDARHLGESLKRLEEMSREHGGDEHVALISYEIWKIDPSQDQARLEAGRLYRKLYARTPMFEVAARLTELTGERPPPTRPLPAPPPMVRSWQADSDQILHRLDELLRHVSSSPPSGSLS